MKKRQNTTARCPYCGTTYRHTGMAERCLRGQLCRVYNQVTGERRAVFDILHLWSEWDEEKRNSHAR